MASVAGTGGQVMVAGVGHPNLRDLSLGPVIVPHLQQLTWPPNVEIDDWSFNPIAIMQRLEARPDAYDRIVLVAAVERGRRPGDIHCYRWTGTLPDTDGIQACVAEAVMGIISLDNLLTILEHFRVFPARVMVVEVEPEETDWGEELSPRLAAATGEVVATIRRAIGEGAGGERAG